ncbi:unnamed protein product [Oncorhynchus mykiss]|uniref:Transmembrane protein 222 n=1 Tax=Oncorhynchus mykiss TaxID=8022 RepID=A0A060WC82_ONCMY|nr:unnamed protein product [Oncorhynchus mykiss]
MKNYHIAFERIDPDTSRYPYCIVWTPIPVLSWLLPFIGHMGICTSSGIIRDFAGPYFVSVSTSVLALLSSSVLSFLLSYFLSVLPLKRLKEIDT